MSRYARLGYIRLPQDWEIEMSRHRLSFEARWHYLGLIMACSKYRAWDGVLDQQDAHRASDATDVGAAHEALAHVGLIDLLGDGGVRVVKVERYLPAKSLWDYRERTENTHILYRFFNTADELLYVGRTNDPEERFKRHAKQQPWWGEVARTETEARASLSDLIRAEQHAIGSEQPKYNVTYNDDVYGGPRHDGVA